MQTQVIGTSKCNEETLDKVLGTTRFITDIKLENQLVAKSLRSPYPHARILAIDVSEAENVPGIVTVLTAKDVPGTNRFGSFVRDRPVLCEDKARSIADVLALVVGESEEAVDEGLAKINVSFQELQAVFTPQEALKDGAPKVHETGNHLRRYRIRKGDVKEAFRKSTIVVEGEYFTQNADSAPLETEAGLAFVDEAGILKVWAATQIPGCDVDQISEVLALPKSKIELMVPPIGGGFGAKCEINCQILVGLAALKTGRPVRMQWSREESFRGHQKRHPCWFRVRTGAGDDGRILAMEEEVFLDAGAYIEWSFGVARNTTVFSTGPYNISNVSIDTHLVYTNNIHSGALRGFGAPQAAFVAELQIEKLAEKLGMDPAEIRLKNAMESGASIANQDVITGSVGFKDTLRRALDMADWEKKRQEIEAWNRAAKGGLRRGLGLACGFKNSGRLDDHAEADIEALPDRVNVYIDSAEMGQGVRRLVAQIAAETLGLPLEKIDVVLSDSLICPRSGDTYSSRQTLCSGNAVLAAAQNLREEILGRVADQWEESPEKIDLVRGKIAGPRGAHVSFFDFVRREYQKGTRFKARGIFQAPAYIDMDPETGKGSCWYAYVFGTQVALVEVDTETGLVVVKELIAVHDVGKAINPIAVEGQIEGGAAMGLGFAMMENFVLEGGQIVTTDLEKYVIPTAMDVPLIRSGYEEDAEILGPFGAKGFAECPVVPTAPAIVNAIHHATGIWIEELPATPERVSMALEKKPRSHPDRTS
jgi:nicotinate dehydrogenase large molybdopterin subunit